MKVLFFISTMILIICAICLICVVAGIDQIQNTLAKIELEIGKMRVKEQPNERHADEG